MVYAIEKIKIEQTIGLNYPNMDIVCIFLVTTLENISSNHVYSTNFCSFSNYDTTVLRTIDEGSSILRCVKKTVKSKASHDEHLYGVRAICGDI